jgi:hypothetical protein
MRKLALSAIVASIFIPAITTQTTAVAQSAAPASNQKNQAEEEHVAIRRVAQLYMTFDQAKLREAFYPTANLYLATEQGELRTIPFAQFLENVAKGAASGRAVPKMSIDLIDHEGSAAIVKITEHSDDATVTDYLSMIRGNEGWKVVSKTFYVNHKAQPVPSGRATETQPQSQNACANTAISGFTFMVGDWITLESPVSAGGASTGASRTEAVLDGCAIWEHRYVEQNGKEVFDAHVVWGYDSVTKRMLLFYIDDRSHTQLYDGRFENGSWAFYRERPDTDGRIILIRVKYAQKGSGFTQSVERSSDHGTTWGAPSIVSYEPKR